jgi:uncharacterized protein YggE
MPVSTRRILFALAFAALTLASTGPMDAAENKPAQRTVAVSASGRVSAAPDMAHVSTGVVSEAATARDALSANTAAMRKVVDGLKEAGIEAKDIQTTSFNIEPRYRHFKDGRPAEITGYQVVNQVRIVARDLPRLGEVLDRVISLGANQVHGIAFEVGEQEKLKDAARREAMANARRRADLYAAAAGATVGPVLSIAEEVRGGFVPRPMVAGRMAMAAEAAPIEAGSQALEVTVHVTWELR